MCIIAEQNNISDVVDDQNMKALSFVEDSSATCIPRGNPCNPNADACCNGSFCDPNIDLGTCARN